MSVFCLKVYTFGHTRAVPPAVQAHAASKDGTNDGQSLHAVVRQCEDALRNGPGGDLRKYAKKQRKPLIIRLLFGSRAAVHAVVSDEAFRMKEEYHSFRSHAARSIILIAGTLLLFIQRSLRLIQDDRDAGDSRPLAAHSFTPMVMVGTQVCHCHSLSAGSWPGCAHDSPAD